MERGHPAPGPDSPATSAGRAILLHPIALAVGLKAQYDSATSGAHCRGLPRIGGGCSFRQLSQVVADISRVLRLTAIGLFVVVILQKLSEAIAISAPQKTDNKPVISQRDISKLFDISDVSDKE